FCGWRPPWLMDDDRVWLLPSAKKAIEVGVVMKRVSADGIDQPDVRKANAPSVVVQLGPREIGRASCRERVEISVGAVSVKKKRKWDGNAGWEAEVRGTRMCAGR